MPDWVVTCADCDLHERVSEHFAAIDVAVDHRLETEPEHDTDISKPAEVSDGD